MSKKVLYVDDDKDWLSMVDISLRDAGYEVLTAQDASAAMRQAEGVELGLIMVDLRLAGESGLTLMKYLKHNHSDVPIMIFTGMDHDDLTIQMMLEQGADKYLHKGTMAELVAAVGEIVK